MAHLPQPFGDHSIADVIKVALTGKGEILVSRQVRVQPGHYDSFRVTCSGSGC